MLRKISALRKLNLILLLSAACVTASAQHAARIVTGQGHYSKNFTDAFSVAGNTASLASSRYLFIGVHTVRKFMVTELAMHTITAGLPVRGGGIGLQLDHGGSGSFAATQLGIGYAKQLGQVDLGCKLNYYNIRMGGYGNAGTLVFDVGSIWHITEKVHTGLQLYNPVGGKLAKEKLPYACRIGLGCEVSEQVLIAAEIIKQENKPADVHAGICYLPVPVCRLQAGIMAAAAQPYISAGLQWKCWRIILGTAYHPQLGMSPALALSYIVPEK